MYIRPAGQLFEEIDGWISEHPCPDCGGEVGWTMACPGYGTPKEEGGRGVMVCSYGCSNATEYRCLSTSGNHDNGCGWWYRTPNKRGDKATMGKPTEWTTDVNASIAAAQEAEDEKNAVPIMVSFTTVEPRPFIAVYGDDEDDE